MKVLCYFLFKNGDVVRKRLSMYESGCVTLIHKGVVRKYVVSDTSKETLVFVENNPMPLDLNTSAPTVLSPAMLHAVLDDSFTRSLVKLSRDTSWWKRLLELFRRREVPFEFGLVADYIEASSTLHDFDGVKAFIISEKCVKDIREGKII